MHDVFSATKQFAIILVQTPPQQRRVYRKDITTPLRFNHNFPQARSTTDKFAVLIFDVVASTLIQAFKLACEAMGPMRIEQ